MAALSRNTREIPIDVVSWTFRTSTSNGPETSQIRIMCTSLSSERLNERKFLYISKEGEDDVIKEIESLIQSKFSEISKWQELLTLPSCYETPSQLRDVLNHRIDPPNEPFGTFLVRHERQSRIVRLEEPQEEKERTGHQRVHFICSLVKSRLTIAQKHFYMTTSSPSQSTLFAGRHGGSAETVFDRNPSTEDLIEKTLRSKVSNPEQWGQLLALPSDQPSSEEFLRICKEK